jgi:ParB/Sulfiredoxin domain
VNEWPADHVERWPIEKLLPYARNSRIHTDTQLENLKASIQRFGWTIPVLVDEAGTLIAGHGRILAAHALGIATVPTMVARGWSDEQVNAYRITDNRMGELSTWNQQLLGAELQSLDESLLPITGFTAAQLENLMAPAVDPETEWRGMPEYGQGSSKPFRSIVVHFMDQGAVDAFARILGQEFTPKTRFTWFPKQERLKAVDHRYLSDDDEPAVSDLHPEQGQE